ncbi:MAG: hypothetical protein IJA10_12475 [Lachnospiraceae bacterium]|nr:hypothetical protein [Lachnospiraceae bacterium]
MKSIYSKFGDVFLVILVWMILLTICIDMWTGFLGDWFLFVSGIISAVLAVRIVNFILLTFRVRRSKRKFLKKQDFLLNGATVISVKDDKLFEVEYVFVEDDEYLSSGVPYGIAVKSFKCDVKDIKEGERLLLIYENDGRNGLSGNISLQIMRMAPEIEDMIPKEGSLNEETMNLKKLMCFPHPNAAKIEKEVRRLEPSEKKEVNRWFLKKEKRIKRNILLGFGTVFFVCYTLFVVQLADLGKLENGLQGKELLVCILAILAVISLLVFLGWACEKIIRSGLEIEYVQEILFKEVKAKSKGQTYPVFYEWNGSKFTEKEYIYGSYRAEYGKVFCKYMNEKGGVILVPKSQCFKDK